MRVEGMRRESESGGDEERGRWRVEGMRREGDGEWRR